MKLSAPRALLASLFAAAALSACSSGSNNNNPTTCTNDNECNAGDTCVNGECLAPGQCATGVLSCTTASQCGSGMACTSGCCAAITGCSSSADCTTATKPHCNTTTHACVPCADNTECSTGKVCVASGACVTGCSSDSSCSGATPHCVTSGGFCAACTESSQCPTSAPFCTANVCTGCTSNANCAAPTPVCDTSTKACVACLDSQNVNGKNPSCAAAKPACESGACVVCNPADNADGGSNGACAVATPSCGAASTCVACTQSSECTAGATCGSDNTCQAVVLTAFAASAGSVQVNGTATFTATLNGDVTMPVNIAVVLTMDGGAQGTLSNGGVITVSSGHTGTITYTAPATAGTVTLTATLGAVSIPASINVSASAAALASVNVVGSGPFAAGSAVMATVTFSAAPTADATVAVSVNNGATINGSATAMITVAAGTDVSAPFTVQLGCGTGNTVVSATYNGVTQTATISPVATAVSVASLTASSTTVASGAPTTLTVTLTGPAGCGGTPVTLFSSNPGFRTTSKVNTYAPGSIVVPVGQTSTTVTVVPECTSNVSNDLIFFSAAVPGTQPVALSTAQTLTDGGVVYTVAPIIMSTIAAGTIGLCPVSPVAADRPLNYAADGGLAPLPTLLTVGFFAPSPAPTGAFAVNLTANQASGTACGTFTQDGGTLPNGKVTLASAVKTEVTFLPSGVAGPCVIAAQGVGPTGTVYDAGVVSTLNLINYNWANQATPTDLSLTKAEIDEDTKISLSDGGSFFGDNTEYVEVFNGTSSTVDLSQYTLVFVGSANDNSTFLFPDGGSAYVFDGGALITSPKHEMWNYTLSGMLAPGAYAIAQDANTFATAPNANTSLLTWPDAGFAANVAAGLSGTSTTSSSALRVGNIANAPGGIFLVKNAGTVNAKIVDGVSYGSPIQQAVSQSITGTAGGIFSWPPAPLTPQDNWIIDNSFMKGSLVRIGYTGFPSLDWTDSSTVSPGAPNNVITAY